MTRAAATRSSPISRPSCRAEWEAFLADAALAGRIVYQVKQLWESLSGQVDIEHLSENSFGSLVPMRGYFYLKSVIDFICALAVLPIALPVMLIIAAAVRLDSAGPVFFRQKRVGHAGKPITVFKFRTMDTVDVERRSDDAHDHDDDGRITEGRPGAAQSPARRAASDPQHPGLADELDRSAARSGAPFRPGTRRKFRSTATATS